MHGVAKRLETQRCHWYAVIHTYTLCARFLKHQHLYLGSWGPKNSRKTPPGEVPRSAFEGPRVSQSLAGIEEVSECVGDLWIV